MSFITTRDAEATLDMYVNNWENWKKPTNVLEKYLPDFIKIQLLGIIGMEDDKWKPLRRKLNKGFQPDGLKFMTRGINYSMRTFLNILYKKSLNGKFDIKPLIENAVFDTVAGSAFGVTMNSQIEESEFSLTIKNLMNNSDPSNTLGMLFMPAC